MTTRVLICVPALDHCATDFAMSLASLMGHTTRDSLRREVSVSLWCQKGSIIMDARNAAVEAALACDATHLLFLDSDMTFPPDTLARLLACARDVVGVDYVRRVPPHSLLGTRDDSAPLEGALIPMLSLPFGCILLKTSVFAKLPRPYFRYITAENGTISEDTWCCMQLRDAGVRIWHNTSLTREVGHVGQAIYRSPA